MRTDEELKQLAKDYVAGHVWTNYDFPDEAAFRASFMILQLMSPKLLRWIEKRKPRMIYAYARTALKMGVNGRPIFLKECAFLGLREYKKFRAYVDKVREALASV